MSTQSTVRKICQAIKSAPDLREAMTILVNHVCIDMSTDACTVFVYDETNQDYVLVATTSNQRLLSGHWRIPRGDGLISIVADKGEPLNLTDATKHPNNIDIKVMGQKQPYRAYLGVPITFQGNVLGVIVTQQHENRKFTEEEVGFMLTLSATIGASVAQAMSSGRVTDLLESPTGAKALWLSGQGAASGVGIGRAVVVYPPADLNAIPDRDTTDTQAEIEAFEEAITAVTKDVRAMLESLSESLSEDEQELFSAYEKILNSKRFHEAVILRIKGGLWVQAALRTVVKANADAFANMDDPYFRERASDVLDLGRRVLAYLQKSDEPRTKYPQDTILVGVDLTAAMLAEVPKKRLAGVISCSGSANSHVAIIARALGVPAAMGVSDLPINHINEKTLIVDGYTGRVYIQPNDTLQKAYRRLASEEQELQENLKSLIDQPAVTQDDFTVSLRANTGLIADIDAAVDFSAEGVGLYRTEMLYMQMERFPGEEEQTAVYRQFLQSFAQHPVIMRTLDAGADKPLAYFTETEENPFLGWRGIRMMLDHPELFLLQVKAMLKASLGLNNLQIMLPMISRLEELRESRRLIKQVYFELRDEGFDVMMPAVGMMVEVPATVYMIEQYLPYVDFVSIGSNDLTQYILAVDRNNSKVAGLYDSFHPAVLRAINFVVKACHAANKPVSLCGELAGNPLATVLLVGMQLESLSVNASALLRIKWVIRGFSQQECSALFEKVLRVDTSQEVRDICQAVLVESGFGGLIRAGKH